MTDADHFKQINDLYGHAAGDAVLVSLATRLRESVRQEDDVVRMGCEELLLLLPGVLDETAVPRGDVRVTMPFTPR